MHAWLICGSLISPSTLCSLPTWRVDKVTYSQMIDIFIRRGECFKTLSAGIYLEHGILQPNTWHAQSHSSRIGRRPKLSPFALSVSMKDRAGPKMAASDLEAQGLLTMTVLGQGEASNPSVLTNSITIFCPSAWYCRFCWRSFNWVPSREALSPKHLGIGAT